MTSGVSLRRGAEFAQRAGTFLLDLVLPPQCLGCDEIVQQTGLLCTACFGRTRFIVPPFCARCGVPFACQEPEGEGGGGRICPACSENPPLFRRARAALVYNDGGKSLILPLKRHEQTWRVHGLAALMARVAGPLLEADKILVPVPLHRSRLRLRGFNQAASLARRLAALSGADMLPDALVRIRATRKLGDLSAVERHAELTDAIAVRPGRASRLRGREVVLVDDVMTTGATANACAGALLDAGAAEVDVLAVARVPDPRVL